MPYSIKKHPDSDYVTQLKLTQRFGHTPSPDEFLEQESLILLHELEMKGLESLQHFLQQRLLWQNCCSKGKKKTESRTEERDKNLHLK